MRLNLETTQGLIFAEAVMMALGDSIGRLAAHQLVKRATRTAVDEGRHLREVLAADPAVSAHIDAAALDALFDPKRYLGVADALARRVLEGRGDG
jgi:3-carboxy-cis,cis-muconate cycloisomerase